ncbi:hypothetical protein EP331_15840 [bacterium]|nr:MAG: hypothetical protein EP331_15840 [bacterium]
MKKNILAILLATIWISISEFLRNEFLLKTDWVNHYDSMGITFPSEPINGAFWGVWSLAFALFIYRISQKFNVLETVLLSWLGGFLMMWIVIGNMSVLPYSILPWAIPLSLLECLLATLIIKKATS